MSQELRNETQRLKPTLLESHEHKCFVCHYDCVHILIVHHIVPLSLSGTNELSNLVVLCPNCHALVHKIMEFSGKAAITDLSPVMFELYSWIVNNLSKEEDIRLLEITNGNRIAQRGTQETAQSAPTPVESEDLW